MREGAGSAMPIHTAAEGPSHGGRLCDCRSDQVSRSAVVIGSRAARSAGNKPPTRPIPSAHFKPLHNNGGDTLNWNTTWLKLLPSVDTVKLLNANHAITPPSRPPSN